MKNDNWKENRAVHLVLVLVVFTCTGLSIARIGVWIAEWAEFERFSLSYWLMWIVGLLPVYNVLLLVFAFIFGKYRYFREKQKRMWRRVTKWMSKD
jgi:uncharacterized BrkB/YihY/UPF0761 family membrane protein